MSRIQQDSFTDDADDSCPLCVEEFDLSDKNFRPCPCGYQVCQFCYHNIKNNMNGLCPACRRSYEDQNIEWKIVSPEEQKADIALQARKKALARKKETEQKQVETNNRKHLAGLRVVQKNLVYVVGLSQQSSEEEFLKTLRGDQYFGQYGKIIKIVVSKAKAGSDNDKSIGVYVTFERREDAAKCIAAVDGSKNLERPLRAQYGTTKYCSAYLRNETCGNRNCTFLHEVGEDYDSFSRQDLSSMNAMSTQRNAHQASASQIHQTSPQPQPPPQQAPQSISAALHSGNSQGSRDDAASRTDSTNGPALPSSANWAAKNTQQEAARSSKPESVSTPSPVTASTSLASQPAESQPAAVQTEERTPDTTTKSNLQTRPPRTPSPFDLLKEKLKRNIPFMFDRSMYSEQRMREIESVPPLFADNGGLIRYRIFKEQEQERMKQEQERNVIGAMSTAEDDENLGSGSLQLGGEPDTQEDPSESASRMSGQSRSTIHPPFTSPSSSYPFRASSFQANNAGNLPRTLTPQQREQLSLLQGGGSTRQSPVSQAPFQQAYGQSTSLHQHQTSNPFQPQLQNPSTFGSAQGHVRQASRYTFSNDSSLAPGAVKPTANPQLSAQQAGVLPAAHGKQYQGQQFQQSAAPNFYSGVQGPPPGLKSSGTPPISGGGMFGQGHGFASAMSGTTGFGGIGSKMGHDDPMQQLLRSRERGNSGQGPDSGKRELKFPFAQQHMSSDAPASSFLSSLYGSQLGGQQGLQDHNLQKQKKKGKKHRHANTSSSGGGGIVDLADPSILQARMHHAGAGQGQFGAQGQNGFNTNGAMYGDPPQAPRFAGAASKIDSLVRDAANIAPSRPPSSKSLLRNIPTPTPPAPGVSSAQEFPSLPTPTKPPVVAAAPPSAQKKILNAKSAASGVKPAIPKKIPSSSLKQVSQSEPQTEQPEIERSTMADMGASTATAEVFNKDTTEPSSSRETDPADTATLKAISAETHDDTFKRPGQGERPIDIDISTAGHSAETGSDIAAKPDKASVNKDGETDNSVVPSRPITPDNIISQQNTPSAAPHSAQHKSLRVGLTPQKHESPTKPETTGTTVPISPGSVSNFASNIEPSRRTSLTSTQQPGTPSDNASLTSASLSRANSPPPSRVGTAPVRQMSKAQQKKERQARAKQVEEVSKAEQSPVKMEEPAVVQEPIVGRKKKTKKAKQGTAESTPAPTRPTSPELKETMDTETQVEPLPALPPKEPKKPSTKPPPVSESKKSEEPAQPPTPSADDQQKQITAAALFSSLTETGELDLAVSDIFKNASGLNTRFENTADLVATAQPALTDEQAHQLDAGQAICIEDRKGHCTVVLPDRRPLPGLSKPQAQRFLDLVSRNGIPPLNPELWHLVPTSKLSTAATAITPLLSAQLAQESKELVNHFATDLPSTNGNGNGNGAVGGQQGGAGGGMQAAGGGEQAPIVALSVEEAEQRFLAQRRETEAIEKKLNALMKKNRRLVLGGGH